MSTWVLLPSCKGCWCSNSISQGVRYCSRNYQLSQAKWFSKGGSCWRPTNGSIAGNKPNWKLNEPGVSGALSQATQQPDSQDSSIIKDQTDKVLRADEGPNSNVIPNCSYLGYIILHPFLSLRSFLPWKLLINGHKYSTYPMLVPKINSRQSSVS